MKKSVRFSAVLLLFALIFTFSPTASAAQPAAPNLLISAIAEATSVEPTLSALHNAGYVNASEKRFIESNGILTYALCWNVALPAYGIFPYPSGCYNVEPFPNRINSSTYGEDARAAAITMGLASATQNPDVPITTTDLQTLLDKLQSGQFNPPAFELDCPYITGNEVWTIDTYTGRNALVAAWDIIPVAWKDGFRTQNWQIKFQLPHTPSDDQAPIPGFTPGGLTVFKDKCIYIIDHRPRAVLHEFVHYASYQVGWDTDFLTAVYESEHTACYKLLGPYSQTSPREFIAEVGSTWLNNPGMRDALQACAPKTTQLVKDLVFNYDELLEAIYAPSSGSNDSIDVNTDLGQDSASTTDTDTNSSVIDTDTVLSENTTSDSSNDNNDSTDTDLSPDDSVNTDVDLTLGITNEDINANNVKLPGLNSLYHLFPLRGLQFLYWTNNTARSIN